MAFEPRRWCGGLSASAVKPIEFHVLSFEFFLQYQIHRGSAMGKPRSLESFAWA